MKIKMYISIILFFSTLMLVAANDKGALPAPEGKIKYSSIFKIKDEKGNFFNFYEDIFKGNLSAAFTYLFTRSEMGAINYTDYLYYNQAFLLYLNSGIAFAASSVLIGAVIPFACMFFYDMYLIIGLAVGAGVFLLCSPIFFGLCGYYFIKAKKTLIQMVDDYNQRITEPTSLQTQINLDLLCIRF